MSELLPLNTAPLRMKLRVEDYQMLDASGAFDAYAKTELIEGDIYFMNAQYRPHGIVKLELYDRLRAALVRLGSSLRPVVEFSLALGAGSQPEPDIMLTSEPRGEGPVPLASVALAIEVSDTTLDYDMGQKARIYAAGDIPEYWVADVNARIIHQMWSPDAGAYRETRRIGFGDPIAAATIAELAIETTAL